MINRLAFQAVFQTLTRQYFCVITSKQNLTIKTNKKSFKHKIYFAKNKYVETLK